MNRLRSWLQSTFGLSRKPHLSEEKFWEILEKMQCKVRVDTFGQIRVNLKFRGETLCLCPVMTVFMLRGGREPSLDMWHACKRIGLNYDFAIDVAFAADMQYVSSAFRTRLLQLVD